MKAAVYLRISLDRHGDGLAIDRQREDCYGIVQARGWELVETYTDSSISASDARKVRPAYDRMIRDWEAGRFDALVCWDLDRLTRQPRQLEDWIDRAEQRGLRLVTANGEADLGTDAGRMFARIKAAVSRQEVDRKSARQRRAAEQRAQRGKPWGSRRPFGYTADRSELVPAEAEAVRRMYADYLAGVPQSAIARQLNEDGHRTTEGGRWAQSTVREFLRSPRNAAIRTYRGEVIGPGAWPPIVSEATWRAAVARMDSTAPTVNKSVRRHLLSGVALCGVCDARARTGYTRTGVRLYTCPNRHVGRDAESVDALVESVAIDYLNGPGRRALTRPETPAPDLAAEADALRARLDVLATEFADGALTAQQLRTATERTRANLEAVTRRMAEQYADPTLGELATADDAAAVWERLDVTRRRAVIDALMTVHIDRTGRGQRFKPEHIRITWKGRDDD